MGHQLCSHSNTSQHFNGTKRFIAEFTRALHQCLSWALPIQSTPPHPISRRSILILSTHLPKQGWLAEKFSIESSLSGLMHEVSVRTYFTIQIKPRCVYLLAPSSWWTENKSLTPRGHLSQAVQVFTEGKPTYHVLIFTGCFRNVNRT
jgi:predicted MPP superfamily phosphohydrolase